MIDIHVHAVHPHLPGVRPLTELYDGPIETLVAAEAHLYGNDLSEMWGQLA